MLFVEQFELYNDKVAFYLADGRQVTYRQLLLKLQSSASELGTTKKLVAVECSNEIESVIAYLTALYAKHPVLLVAEGTCSSQNQILDTFKPEMVFSKNSAGKWCWQQCHNEVSQYHEDLCILLSTSGTTGSAKLVRLSQQNIQSNALAIAEYLNIDSEHTAITTLPYHYSYGMSVINSHLAVGASIVLTNDSVTDSSFWQLVEKHQVSSLAGVPYTFELLEKQGVREKHYASLKYITQAGGRLPMPLVEKYTQWAEASDSQFYVMYGQTEAAPRIAYVPPALLAENGDCIGKPIPGGQIELQDENGSFITEEDTEGELVYYGENVMMGYATEKSELQLPSGDNILRTGDLAVRKANGLFKIVGRKSRFCKLFGLRISLDEVEAEVHRLGISSVVVGNDDFITVAVLKAGEELRITEYLATKYKLNVESFIVMTFDEYPLLPSGKVDQRKILSLAAESRQNDTSYESLLAAYQKIMNNPEIVETDSFVGIGGDSLFFVMVSIAVEEYIGYLPENWEGTSICELEALKNNQALAQPEIRRPTAILSIVLICLSLIFGEVFLQSYIYYKTGRSALALLTDQSARVFNEELGIFTYRPNLQLKDAKSDAITMKINKVGLRSEPIPENKNDTRIAILGASTVAGAYAKNNQSTFPALFGKYLQEQTEGNESFHVINAGIEGHTLVHTSKLFDGVVSQLSPDVVMLYPGFNDISLLCRAMSDSEKPAYIGIDYPTLPTWVETKSMIRKNTTQLRANNTSEANLLALSDVDAGVYGNRVREIITSIKSQGIQPALMTVSRAYANTDEAVANSFLKDSLYYYSCLNAESLMAIGDMYNEQIRLVAKETNTPLFDLAKVMAGGRKYFVDGSHFTYEGEQYVARFLLDQYRQLHPYNQLNIAQEDK
ncbi:AMP-binding protein [Thalassotalea fusca]